MVKIMNSVKDVFICPLLEPTENDAWLMCVSLQISLLNDNATNEFSV